MRIVHIMGDLGGGGIQRLLLSLLTLPDQARHQQIVISMSGGEGPLRVEYERAGIQVVYVPVPWPPVLRLPSYRLSKQIRRLLSVTFRWRLLSVLRKLRPDVVHTHLTHLVDAQAWAARRIGVPWVWTVHGQYRPVPRELQRWRRASALAGTGPFRITAVSTAVAQQIAGLLPDDASRIRVVYSGALRTEAAPRLDPALSARNLVGFPPGGPLFASLGRLVWEKAYDVMIDAAALVQRQLPEARFVIGGEGRDGEALLERIRAAGLASTFKLQGFVGDVRSFLADVDVFVLPSRSEGFGIALIEGLAAGLPCIGTKVGGIPEILADGAGLLVPPESSRELADAMVELGDPERRRAFGARALVAAGKFTAHETARKFEEIYQELVVAR